MPAQRKDQLLTRARQQAQRTRQQAKARRACTDTVWAGEFYQPCYYCGRTVARGGTFYQAVGGVHEPRARSLGGDPTDATANVIACTSCHFNGPSGAHRRSVRA